MWKFKRRGEEGIVSRYEFDENAYNECRRLTFDAYSEEWLDFILICRSGKDTSDYDIKPNLQICFRTEDILKKYLQFKGSERV